MRRLLPLAAFAPLALTSAVPSAAAPPPARDARDALVRLDTSLGPIVIDLDLAHAPITAGNFLHYVEAGRFDGITFYRAARSKRDPATGFVQGGINHQAKLAFFAIDHEPTTRTGIHHLDGTLSMARNAPGTAAGDWIICVGNQTFLDARPNWPGYAAFGHVVSGMAVVKRILQMPTWPGGYSREMKDQTLRQPVRILRARRVPGR